MTTTSKTATFNVLNIALALNSLVMIASDEHLEYTKELVKTVEDNVLALIDELKAEEKA